MSKLQLTTLAVLVSAALPAQAALYKVVEVTPAVSGNEYYGTAIQPSKEDLNTTNPLGCFGADCADATEYSLAGETRNRAEGFSYREEVPFAMDHSFGYIEDNYSGFEDYCFYQLGYSTCEYWAIAQYSNGWSKELNGEKESNSLAFITDNGKLPPVSGAINTVINSLTLDKVAVGNSSTSAKRNIGFSDITNTTQIDEPQSHAWFSDGTYTVGSITKKSGIGSDRYYYSSKAAIWDDTTLTQIKWVQNVEKDGDYYAQGSLRKFYNDGSKIYAVGYNNYKDQHLNATVFIGDATDITKTWTSKEIQGAQVRISGDNVNTNSVATDINQNLVVVGSAKRSGNYPQNGAAANRLFVVPDASVSSPSAEFLSGGIFFNGAGGQIGSINNFNEIVGRVDIETHREYEGKQRRQRAFIYPYGVTGQVGNTTMKAAIENRQTIFKDKAWVIDDLTNGGTESSHNNQYRIYDATDINDMGVISATAVKCSIGEYDSTNHDAYCGNGDAEESIVAVKLVPIPEVNAEIQPREYTVRTTERQGSSVGFLALTLIGLFGFMRKSIK